MFLVNPEMVNLNIAEAGLVALTGYAVVFFGLMLLRATI